MKTWDVVIVGGGLIGISLALELRRKGGAQVLVVDRSEPGREASHAAAGMLAHCDHHTPAALLPLAHASAKLYPEFVHELEDESGTKIDFQREGAIVFLESGAQPACQGAQELEDAELRELDPHLAYRAGRASLLPEGVVDPRNLMDSALKAARHHGVHIASGAEVTGIDVSNLGVTGVTTAKTRYAAPVVVNCAGAWAGQFSPIKLPTRPVKGHMLAVASPISYTTHGTPTSERLLRHVVRLPGRVYLAPRSDGRIVIGSTLEEAGYDKRVEPLTVQLLHQAATDLVPEIARAKMLESWAGLRPGTPDSLPVLGATRVAGYFVATGHYRDGILLAPITARLLAQVIRGEQPEIDLGPFSAERFNAK